MSKDAVILNRIERVSRVLQILANTSHNGFPVVEGPVLIGCILRTQLLLLLQTRRFQSSSERDLSNNELDAVDANAIELPVLNLSDIELSPEEQGLYLDIGPFINANPYAIPEGCSLTKVYNLFRSLGLRHLVVVKQHTEVVGLITRKDLLQDFVGQRFRTRSQSAIERTERIAGMLKRRKGSVSTVPTANQEHLGERGTDPEDGSKEDDDTSARLDRVVVKRSLL